MSVKAITPAEVRSHEEFRDIPSWVLEAFNELLKEQSHKAVIQILQTEAMKRVLEKCPSETMTSGKIYAERWMDVEDTYRRAGWVVTYCKQPYNSQDANYYEFRAM